MSLICVLVLDGIKEICLDNMGHFLSNDLLR
jgi:hypothetical protein